MDVSEDYVKVVLLLCNGEERLLIAMGRGEIPVSVAVEIAVSDDASVQRSSPKRMRVGSCVGRCSFVRALSSTIGRRVGRP